ncbi:hypothetical protein [Massilia sp. METH4]|uniref:hypothetical protein n=1 Tax=Massilia sp. METH4 TaxID=3123041 RepID=UPI0030CF3622
MARQTQFYVTPEDIADIEAAITSRCGDFVIVQIRSESAFPRLIDTMNHAENAKRWLYYFIARPEDVSKIVLNFVGAQHYWAIDPTINPVIEFHCSYLDGQIVRGGRAYYSARYYDKNGVERSKDEEFLAWADCVMASVRSRLTRYQSRYAGPRLKLLCESGGNIKFEQ